MTSPWLRQKAWGEHVCEERARLRCTSSGVRAVSERAGEFRRYVHTQIAANNATMRSLEAQKQQRLAVVKTVAENAPFWLVLTHCTNWRATGKTVLWVGRFS